MKPAPVMKQQPPGAALMKGPDEAYPVGNFELTGVIKTSRGFAVATITLSREGRVVEMKLGRSQTYKEFIALEHREVARAASQRA